jgi:xylose dehydrogenase (NAD/NADP)
VGEARQGSVGFGFIGAGGIAQRALGPAVHAAAGAHLQAAASRAPARAEALGLAGKAYGSYDELLADPSVEVVYVALNNDGHRPWTLAALAAGKHVLCEKPLGLDPGEIEEMTAAAAAAGRLLVEAFWYRWHPRTRRLEELVSQGALGPLQTLEADFSFDGPREGDLATHYRLDPSRGGGALYDVGCYALSAAHTVLGPWLTLEDATEDVGPTGVDLATHAQLRAPSGALADIRGGIHGSDRQVLRVTGEAARLEFSDPVFMSWHTPSSLTITTPDGGVRVEEFAPVDPYMLMVEAVAARVRGESAFLVGLEHTAQVSASIDAIRRRLHDSAGAPGGTTASSAGGSAGTVGSGA